MTVEKLHVIAFWDGYLDLSKLTVIKIVLTYIYHVLDITDKH